MATATITPKSVENAIRRSYKRFNLSVNKLFGSPTDTTAFMEDVNKQLSEKNQFATAEQLKTVTRQLYRRGSENGGLPPLER